MRLLHTTTPAALPQPTLLQPTLPRLSITAPPHTYGQLFELCSPPTDQQHQQERGTRISSSTTRPPGRYDVILRVTNTFGGTSAALQRVTAEHANATTLVETELVCPTSLHSTLHLHFIYTSFSHFI